MDNAQESPEEPPRIVLRRKETNLAPMPDKVLEPFTAQEWRGFTVLMRDKPVSGRVRTFQAARRAKMRVGWTVGGLLAALMAVVAFFAGLPQNIPLILGIAVIVWVACGAVCWLWLAVVEPQFRERLVGHVEPGTLVSVDNNGLSLDARTFGWPDLALAEVVLRPDGDDSILLRLRLVGALAGVDLDVDLIENGRDIVESVFLRLYPQPVE